jgi:SAM-dependent methyltransferase
MRTEAVLCNACGSSERSLLAGFVLYRPVSLVKCRGCGLLYVSPRLTGPSLLWHFNTNYLRAAAGLAWEESRRRVYGQVLDLVRRHGKRQVFDIGCSYGTFLAMCRDAGLAIGGCDVSREACRVAAARVGTTIFNADVEGIHATVPAQECIVSIDTLYYAPDPQRQLSLIHTMLKPDGVLILRVRNGLYAELTARLGLGTFPVEHLYFFAPRTLGRLLGRAGFRRWRVVPAVGKGVSPPADRVMRSLSGCVAALSRGAWMPARDFCVVATKAAATTRAPAERG